MLHTENNLIFYKDHCWRVIAIINEDPDDNIRTLRIKYQADLVLRKRNQLYLCEHIPEAKIIEETKKDSE